MDTGASQPCQPETAPSVFPLVAHPSGRYLVSQSGSAFFMVGDAAQSAASALTQAEWQSYIDTRVAQGFNTVNVNFMEHRYSPNAPYDRSTTCDGAPCAPFTTTIDGAPYTSTSQNPDLTTANDNYWMGVEQKVAYALSKGVVVSLAFYMGMWSNHIEGWYNELAANSLTAATSFGTYLANGRGGFGGFKKYPNVIWVWGADWYYDPDATNRDKLHAVAAAVKTAGATQLMSGDWNAGLATRQDGFQTYMDLESLYAYDPNIASTSRRGFSYVPSTAAGDGRALSALPVFMKETGYEGESNPSADPASIRSYGWTTILNGATAGYWYGHRDIWNFARPSHGYSPCLFQPCTDWTASITSAGAQDVTRMSTFINSISWWKLRPSGTSAPFIGRKLVPSGETADDTGAISAAQASDGTFMLVYVPSTGTGMQSFTVDPRSMAGTARGRWWDPTAATFRNASPANIANTSTQAFTTPGTNSAGQNDWLLVLDVTSS